MTIGMTLIIIFLDRGLEQQPAVAARAKEEEEDEDEDEASSSEEERARRRRRRRRHRDTRTFAQIRKDDEPFYAFLRANFY